MLNLKFLEFDNMMISSSPRILSNSLRSIKWSWYPSKFLPSGFLPKSLISVEMPHSKLVQLWDGRKDLTNLKYMNLSSSERLTTTPDFSGMPNLEVLEFPYCDNLVDIHPSVADLKCLKRLIFGFCRKLKKIPEFSGQMKILSSIDLQGTSIEKLPSSIGCLVGLSSLILSNCKNLVGLPSEICNLKFLRILGVCGCPKIDKLPENVGEMECLEMLRLDGTSIRQLPRSVVGLFSLRQLDLSNCGVCEADLPSDIGCLSSLEVLKLSGNNFVSLPASIGCLSKLKYFWVNGCQSLEQLPDLSKLISLVDINIANCTSLKMLPHFSPNCSLPHYIFLSSGCLYPRVDCANCFVLVDNEGYDSIILKMLQRYLQLQVQVDFEILTPGRKIPEWFSNQSLGDSLTLEPPLDSCTTWMGIALCALFEGRADLSDLKIHCYAQGLLPHGVDKCFEKGDVVSDHLWIIYVPRKQFEKICSQIKVLFTTYYLNNQRVEQDEISCVKKCGFRLVHEHDVEQLNQIMMNKSIIKSTTTCPTKSADAQGQQRHDDQEASPSGSGSSHQKSLFCNTYALSEEADQDEIK